MKMNSNKILSDITVYSKYARYIPEEKRRETWEEIVERNIVMHEKQYPLLTDDIRYAYEQFVLPKKVLPSMRSLQFAGEPIQRSPNRIFNCAYLPIDHPDAFSELMFLLLGGTGGGYSVQKQHVTKLPKILGVNEDKRRYVIGDHIEGWADAVKVLVEAHFYGKSLPIFDFSDIREKGVQLITSGGKAPGPEPLKKCLEQLSVILEGAKGRRLRTMECHDLVCHIADAVLAGGIRRAALISLFSRDDEDMLSCKKGNWWEDNPQRGRANNSVVLPRGMMHDNKTPYVSKEAFMTLWEKVEASGSGEPGVYWTNNTDWGTNP